MSIDAEETARVLDQIYNRFDADMNNEITSAELHAALVAEGVDAPTAAAVRDAVFGDWDVDGNGRLALSEVRELAAAWASPPGDQS